MPVRLSSGQEASCLSASNRASQRQNARVDTPSISAAWSAESRPPRRRLHISPKILSRLIYICFTLVIARTPRLLDAPLRGASTGQFACYLGRTNRIFATGRQRDKPLKLLRRSGPRPVERHPRARAPRGGRGGSARRISRHFLGRYRSSGESAYRKFAALTIQGIDPRSATPYVANWRKSPRI